MLKGAGASCGLLSTVYFLLCRGMAVGFGLEELKVDQEGVGSADNVSSRRYSAGRPVLSREAALENTEG